MSNLHGKPAAVRKAHPLFSGVMKYFPDALLEVAELSKIGNEQHNPGQPLHWSKDKSNDHGDCIARHQLDVGTRDTDNVRHATKVAWRALAQLQIEIEAEIAVTNKIAAEGPESWPTTQLQGLTSTQITDAFPPSEREKFLS